MFAAHGLADVTLLRQLPVAYVVAGYTRESARLGVDQPSGQRSPTHFKFFPGQIREGPHVRGPNRDRRAAVPARPARVVDWLVAPASSPTRA